MSPAGLNSPRFALNNFKAVGPFYVTSSLTMRVPISLAVTGLARNPRSTTI